MASTLTKEAVVEKPVKGDPYKRTQEQVDLDTRFIEDYAACGRGKPVDTAQYAPPKSTVEVSVRKDGEATSTQLEIPTGPYDFEEVKRAIKDNGGDPVKTKAALRELRKNGRYVMVADEGHIGQRGDVRLVGPAITTGRFITPLPGTILEFVPSKTNPVTGVFDSSEEYLAALPAMRAYWRGHNGWTIDPPSERAAVIAGDCPAMLAELRRQLRPLAGAEVYSVRPVWLRYYSDGDMKSQRPGEYGLRLAPGGQGGMAPLLYDGLAFAVGLKIGESYLPGRVFVNREGMFMASDWCQREVDKKGYGIDLITGRHTKHTLLTWMAGPGQSRFGSTAKGMQPLKKLELGASGAPQMSDESKFTLARIVKQIKTRALVSVTSLDVATVGPIAFVERRTGRFVIMAKGGLPVPGKSVMVYLYGSRIDSAMRPDPSSTGKGSVQGGWAIPYSVYRTWDTVIELDDRERVMKFLQEVVPSRASVVR